MALVDAKPDIKYVGEIDVERYTKRDQEKIRSLESKIRHTEFDRSTGVKLVNDQWKEYAKKHKPDVKAYNQAFAARQKESKATLSPSENIAWITVGAVVAKAEAEIVRVNEKYKQKLEKLLKQRDSIVEVAEKKIKRKEQGKGLYDSEEEKVQEESVELRPEDQLVDPTETQSKVVGAEPETVERLFNGLTRSQVKQYSEKVTELEQLALKLGAYTTNYTAEREYHPRNSYQRARYDRLVSKFVVYSNIVQNRLNTIKRIIEGERLTLEQKEYTDYSDGGYSEPDKVNEDLSKLKVRKRKRRTPIPRKEDFEETDEEQEEQEQEQEEVEQREYRQDSEQETELASNSDSETETFDIENMFNGAGRGRGNGGNGDGNQGNPGNQMRWSIQNINKFHGGKGEDPDHHISEFEDVLRASGNFPLNNGDWQNHGAQIFTLFQTTLRERARTWYDHTIGRDERDTREHYEALKNKFKDHFNTFGSTQMQRISVFKNLRWDPAVEGIEDFAYKYEKLGKSLEFDDNALFISFQSTIPVHIMMFVGDAQTFPDMVSKIKAIMSRGMTGNPAMMFGGMQPAQSTQPTVAVPQVSQTSAVPKFMMMKDSDSRSDSKDLVKEMTKVVEDSISYMGDGLEVLNDRVDGLFAMIDDTNRQSWNRQFQNQGRPRNGWNNRGQGRFNRQGQGQGRGRGQNFMQGQRDRKQELHCTYCKKSRHTIADCYTLKLDLKARGFKIDKLNGSQNFGKTMSNQQGQGRRWNNGGNGGNGRNRGNGRQGFGNRDRFNMMADEDETDDGAEEEEEEDFFCHISDYMAATGHDVYDMSEESTNE